MNAARRSYGYAGERYRSGDAALLDAEQVLRDAEDVLGLHPHPGDDRSRGAHRSRDAAGSADLRQWMWATPSIQVSPPSKERSLRHFQEPVPIS